MTSNPKPPSPAPLAIAKKPIVRNHPHLAEADRDKLAFILDHEYGGDLARLAAAITLLCPIDPELQTRRPVSPGVVRSTIRGALHQHAYNVTWIGTFVQQHTRSASAPPPPPRPAAPVRQLPLPRPGWSLLEGIKELGLMTAHAQHLAQLTIRHQPALPREQTDSAWKILNLLHVDLDPGRLNTTPPDPDTDP